MVYPKVISLVKIDDLSMGHHMGQQDHPKKMNGYELYLLIGYQYIHSFT